MRKRYGNSAKHKFFEKAQTQVRRELTLIAQLGFAGYFLIVWDIIRYCQQHGILVQGRGSAANSAVCYALEITAVDPIELELLFERFLSESRDEWPDIDLDLPSGDEREKVIQHVFEQYGAQGSAITANVITYRGRSAAREVGKALGFDEATAARLSSLIGHWEWKGPNDSLTRSFENAGFDIHHARIARYPRSMFAPTRHASPSRPALRRHDRMRRHAQSHRAHRAQLHARPHRRTVG